MKKILIAVDGSAASLNAARMALELGRPSGAEAILVHVVPAGFVPPPEIPYGAMPFADDGLKVGAAMLKETAEKLGLEGGRTLVLVGAAAEQICDLAEKEGADLIVVGSKGRGAVSRVLIGSVTDRLVHISTKPVLVVR